MKPSTGAEIPDDQRCLDDMTLASNVRKSVIEECAKIADDLAKHEGKIFDAADSDRALSETGRHRVQDRAIARQMAAEAIARQVRALSDGAAK